MAPSYYVIELTGRWLTILLAALALVMVLAFAFGYGAAWSVLSIVRPACRRRWWPGRPRRRRLRRRW